MSSGFQAGNFDLFANIPQGGPLFNLKPTKPGFRIGQKAVAGGGQQANVFVPQATGNASAIGQLGAALKSDVNRLQGAADRQFTRVNDAAGDIGSLLDGVGPDTGADTGVLDDLRVKAGQQGDEFMQRQEDLFGDVMDTTHRRVEDIFTGTASTLKRAQEFVDGTLAGNIKSIQTYAAAGVQAAQSAVEGYDANSQRAMQAAAAGLEARAESSRRMIEAGVNPDGSIMTAEEKAAATSQLRNDVSLQVAQVTAQMGEAQRQFGANLGMALASANMQAGGLEGQAAELGLAGEQFVAGVAQEGDRTRLAATELEAQTGLSVADARARSEQVRQGYTQIQSALAEISTNIKNSAVWKALDFKMQGRTTIAQILMNNPENIVTMFSGLASMVQLAAAPGGANLPGLPLP